MKIIVRMKTSVFAGPSLHSPLVAELDPGTEAELGATHRHAGRDWTVIKLADARRGFVDASISYLSVKPARIVQPGGVNMRAEPTLESPLRRRLISGEEITPLALSEHEGRAWLRVRDGRGIEGFLPADTPLGAAVPGFLESLGGGALVIVALGAIGAAVLCLRGDMLGALTVLILSVLGGALAAAIHWLVAPLRVSLFGAPLAWMLILDAYLFAVGLGVGVVGNSEMIHEPLMWLALAAVGVLGGVVCGYAVLYERVLENQPVPPAAWFVPLVGAVGLLALGFGAYQFALYERDSLLFSLTQDDPADITLQELLDYGVPGENHFIRLRSFRHCRIGVTINENNRGPLTATIQWVPVIPAAGPPPPQQLERSITDRPKTPRYIQAVIVHTDKVWKKPSGMDSAPKDLSDFSAVRDEFNGYVGVVLNGVQSIAPEDLEKLRQLAPDTDLDQVVVIDKGVVPIPAETMHKRLTQGRGGLGAGCALLLVAGGWTWAAGRKRTRPADVAA